MGQRRDEAGFTLIEALLALAVFSIAFISILLIYKQSFSVSWQSKEQVAATILAKDRLESLKVTDNDPSQWDTISWNETKTKTVNGVTYTITTAVITGTSMFSNTSNVKPVRVTVSWSSHGKNSSISMDSCFFRNYSL